MRLEPRGQYFEDESRCQNDLSFKTLVEVENHSVVIMKLANCKDRKYKLRSLINLSYNHNPVVSSIDVRHYRLSVTYTNTSYILTLSDKIH